MSYHGLKSTYPYTPIYSDDYTIIGNFSFVLSNGTTENLKCKWNALNTVLTALLVLTLVMNVLASVVLFRVPLVTVRGRSNPVYLCIRFLNITDIIQALLLLIMPAFASPNCDWLGGKISCSAMGFMALFLLLVSPLITILMAFDRVIALYQPFKYRSHLGLKMLKILLPSACAFVLFTTILPMVGVGEYHVVTGRRFCLLDTITDDPIDRSYVLAVHAIFLGALLFMAACTVTFQVKLCFMSFDKKHKELQSKSTARKKASGRRTRNATITTMAVCGIFIICYLPYVSRVLNENSSGKKSSAWATWITFGLAFMQPLLNPIVYVATNVRYRQELQVLFRRIKNRDVETSTDSLTGTSRGPFAEFRRRFSSSGKRKTSAHEILRGKDKQTSITSPSSTQINLRSGKQNKFLYSRTSEKEIQKSSSNSEVYEEHVTTKPLYTTSSLEKRGAIALVMHRTCPKGGIRSNDSRELLRIPQNQQKQQIFAGFGRLGRNEGDSEKSSDIESCGRDRSHTISGDATPVAAMATRTRELRDSQCSNSVPLLVANTEMVSTHDVSCDCDTILTYDRSPRQSRREWRAEKKDRNDKKPSSEEGGRNKDKGDNAALNEVLASKDTTEETISATDFIVPSQPADQQSQRGKLDRLEDIRKPSHRDSGVIDDGSDRST